MKPFKGDYESGVTSIEIDSIDDNYIYIGCYNS